MIRTTFIAALATLASTTLAIAADAVTQVPEAPAAVETAVPFSWAGGYAGIYGGYGWLDGVFTQGGATLEDDFDGGRIGGFGGWNFDLGNNVILGVEGDISYDWNENVYTGVDVGTDLSGSVRARAGYAIDHALLFVAGGWTAQKAYIQDEKEALNGWTIGAGVDFAVTDRIFTRVEYRYNDFGSTNIGSYGFDSKQNVVNLGVGIKF